MVRLDQPWSGLTSHCQAWPCFTCNWRRAARLLYPKYGRLF